MHNRIVKVLMPTVAGALTALLMAGTAAAAPHVSARSTRSVTPQDSCSTNPKQNGEDVASNSYTRSNGLRGTFTTTIELWYSPTCRYVWAVLVNGFAAGGFSDYFWVYNENTGAIKKATYPTTSTGAINDANTLSHACMENDGSFDNETMPKTCTAYF